MTIFDIFSMLGGLALFLFGMDWMGKSLEKQAGGKLEKILAKLTDSPLKGFILGVLVTAVIQSSSATTVMVVGFVNSGIMKLRQAIGIIMGSNVGTTVTAWLLSMSDIEGDNWVLQMLKPDTFSPLLAFIGIVLIMFFKSDKKKGIGNILVGFAVLMTGMDIMSSAVAGLKEVDWFCNLFTLFTNPFLGVLAGAILTAIIQSSSASVGILQALSATGAITFGSAIPIILGQNIGTCATAMISSIGTNKNARRTALVHLYFNIIGVTLFFIVFYPLTWVVKMDFLGDAVSASSIAIVHTIFNVCATAVLLPFNRLLEKLALMTIRDKEGEEDKISLLDERLLATPGIAVERTRMTAADMAKNVQEGLFKAFDLIHNKWDASLATAVNDHEDVTDTYEDALGSYLVKLSMQETTNEDSRMVSMLLHTIGDFERIGDHAVNLMKSGREMYEKDIQFSDAARKELDILDAATRDLVEVTFRCFAENDCENAARVEPLEQVIDDLVREIKSRHIARLKNGQCSIAYGFVLDDILTNYERIADHCSNIAVAMIEVNHGSFDTHAYLNNLKGNNESFKLMYEGYRTRYSFSEEA